MNFVLVTSCDRALWFFSFRLLSGLRMMGTRSGARTSVSVKKALKKKNVTKEVMEKEMNNHGFRVMGMTSRESTDGKAEGALSERIFTKKRL